MKSTKILLLFIIIVAAILRFWEISNTPPSMYWDEVSQGYNTYSIMTTARDEHNEFLPIARFIAFGDYKAPVYIYLDVPFMALFGKDTLGVRFPSAFFGTLTVLALYFFAKELFEKQKYKEGIGLASAFLLAISPWHIQLSKAAYEGNIATFFTILAAWLFFLSKRKNMWWILASSISFVIGFYAFNAYRVFIPLFVVLLAVIYWRNLFTKKNIFPILSAVVVGFFLLIPFLVYLKTPESKLRFQEVNIFTDSTIVQQANQWSKEDNNSLVAKVIHNRRVLYGLSYVGHYFDFFNTNFLFFSGDINPRFSMRDSGELYLWELPLLLYGIYLLLNLRNKTTLTIIGWFLLAPIAAATARETPHALRAESFLPTYQLIGALGLVGLWTIFGKYKILIKPAIAFFAIIVMGSLYIFLHDYFVHFPINYSYDWQYGYKEAVQFTQSHLDNYDTIAFTNTYGRPYIYVLFYGNISPQTYWRDGIVTHDVFGFYNVDKIGKYEFRDILIQPADIGKRVLYVGDPKQIPNTMHVLQRINFLNGKPDFIIATNS